MAWERALPLNELEEKKRHHLKLNNQDILLIWHEDGIHAIQSQCPHFKLPLGKGEVTKKCTIICPFHKSEFDLKTGKVKCWSPWPKMVGKFLGKLSKEKPLKVYPTKLEDNIIWVDA